MILSHIIDSFNQTSQSIGLPPIVLFFIIAISFFIFILGLVVLIKIRKIRIDLMDTNRHLNNLNQRLQVDKERLKAANYNLNMESDNSNIEFQKHGEKNSVNNHPKKAIPFTEIHGQSMNQTEIITDSNDHKAKLLENLKKKPDLRHKILYFLKKNSKPISYSEIAKYLSQGSSETDFELILKELEYLKTEGEIIDHVSAGKLYFQKNQRAI